jgi:putative transposase
MARKSIYYQVTDPQRDELVTMQRSLKLQKRYVDRANVVILSSEGKTIDQIMEYTKLSRRAVNKWRQRFKSFGIEGLKDAPRKGKPPIITQEKKLLVIQKACSKPEGGYTNWSQARIAKEVGISQSKVFQILRETDLKPHKTEYWCGKSLLMTTLLNN